MSDTDKEAQDTPMEFETVTVDKAQWEYLNAFKSKIEEAEGRCCPEDYGFEEWIGVLTKRDGHLAHGHLQALVGLLLGTRVPIGPMRDRKDYPSELQDAINYLHGRSQPSASRPKMVCYSLCKAHSGMSYEMTFTGYAESVVPVCPICNPPEKR